MPCAGSAYTEFIQNDRTIENPGEWEEKRRKFVEICPLFFTGRI
jgi:hypothetical protein